MEMKSQPLKSYLLCCESLHYVPLGRYCLDYGAQDCYDTLSSLDEMKQSWLFFKLNYM